MARIRTIKPEFFTSLTIADLPLTARLTFIGLWTQSDDQGRSVADARLIKAAIWPLDDRTTADVELDLKILTEASLIAHYKVGNRRYFQVRGWAEHQKINRPSTSKLPAVEDGEIVPLTCTDRSSLNPHGNLMEDSPQERKGKEGKGTGKGTTTTTQTKPPNPADEAQQIPAWATPLVDALTREGLTVRWNLAVWEWVSIQTMLGTLGELTMIEHARRSWKPEDPPAHARYFFKVWRDLPPIPADAPLKPEIAPASKQLTTADGRKQQHTDDLFADAYARAEAKDRAEAEMGRS